MATPYALVGFGAAAGALIAKSEDPKVGARARRYAERHGLNQQPESS